MIRILTSNIRKYLGHRLGEFPFFGARKFLAKKVSTTSTLVPADVKKKTDVLFLHIAPCGDFWIGHEVFAAKHLQPDYVRSIAIPVEMEGGIESLLHDYDGDLDALLKRAYDESDISILIENLHTQPLDDS